MKEDSNKRNLGMEEEMTKEGSPRRVVPTELEVLQESLPPELKGIAYSDEGVLWEAQQKIGLSDLQIVLNSEGYAVWREMPDPNRNTGVRVISREFGKWKRKQEQEQVDILFGEKDADVFLSHSFENNKKRCPNFAIWGPGRLDDSGSVSAILKNP
jgi:hypothetical protein